MPNSCIEFNSRYINIANWQAVHLYVQNAFFACWCTPQSPKTMKINFHGATPIGFVILMCFQHFINSSLPFPIYEIIFYTDSVYPRCWKNFVFINFSNIRDKAGKEFLFISWLYHGNLSVSLKTRNILCIQNLPY